MWRASPSTYPFQAREALTFALDGGDPAAHETESPWGGGFKYFVGANLMPLVTMYDEGSSGQLLGHAVQVHCLLFVDSRKMSAAGLEAAKGRLLNKMSRRQLMDHVIPILVSLKHKLESVHSPLLKDVMAYLRELTRSFKSEVKAVLATDPTLAKG